MIRLSSIFSIVLIGFALPPYALASSFWKVSDAYHQRLSATKEAVKKCAKGLKFYFPETPGKLEILLYPSREAFIEGLQNELGFSQRFALVFKEHGAPRPMNGKMLVPPEQTMENMCHELVHHYMENIVGREKLLNAKWFDEGVATVLAGRIMEGKKLGASAGQGPIIPLEKMLTETQWRKLWSDPALRGAAYTQAALMVGFFFETYSIGQFRYILDRMQSEPFAEAFQTITGATPETFYRTWQTKRSGLTF